jgi:hypothetical protein
MQNVLSLQLLPRPSMADPCLSSGVSCESHQSCESRISQYAEEEVQ